MSLLTANAKDRAYTILPKIRTDQGARDPNASTYEDQVDDQDDPAVSG